MKRDISRFVKSPLPNPRSKNQLQKRREARIESVRSMIENGILAIPTGTIDLLKIQGKAK